jgi:hypothetical protein
MVGFIFNLLAGIGLWSHSRANAIEVPTYDRFVAELRHTSDAQLPVLAKSTFENWSSCQSSLGGMSSVAVHATVTGSVAGIVFFGICLVLGWQLHQKVRQVTAAGTPPQPPEPVDDTWRERR